MPMRKPRPRKGPSAIPRTETGSGPSAWAQDATAGQRLVLGTASRNYSDPRLTTDAACRASWKTLRGRRPRVGPQ